MFSSRSKALQIPPAYDFAHGPWFIIRKAAWHCTSTTSGKLCGILFLHVASGAKDLRDQCEWALRFKAEKSTV